jgi:WD40 repeat protein
MGSKGASALRPTTSWWYRCDVCTQHALIGCERNRDTSQADLWANRQCGEIVQDSSENTQRALQGHVNAIMCVCSGASKRVVLSADSGPGSMLIAWDADHRKQLWALSDPHPHGVGAMDIMSDGSCLVTLSASGGDETIQDIALWDTSDLDAPPRRLLSVAIPAGDLQVRLALSNMLNVLSLTAAPRLSRCPQLWPVVVAMQSSLWSHQ